MQVADTVEALAKELEDLRSRRGRPLGLVPTMGALHAGHTSLIARAAAECPSVVVTIFVNPLQFDDPGDLDAYPRDLASDLEVAAAAGAHLVFTPQPEEMWPPDAATTVSVAGLSERFEGASRPGHFDGVATVVTKLLALVGPDRAYFGEKDYQQLQVVRRLAADLGFAAEMDVVGCETVREPDGLALSSRNARLGPADRPAARALSQALRAGADQVGAGVSSADAVRAAMQRELSGQPGLELDYAEVVDPVTLDPLECVDGDVRLLVAARVGGVRLIDNAAAAPGEAGR